MRINEIFWSINGEGLHQGEPTVFVRLQGCNLKTPCKWCDTPYALDPNGGAAFTTLSLLAEVGKFNAKWGTWVCITGGEPLLQALALGEFITALKFNGYRVEIETNGTLLAPPWYEVVDSWCIDVKCPSSGTVFPFTTLLSDDLTDQAKFVVANENDLKYVECILPRIEHARPLISPVMSNDKPIDVQWMRRCVEFCKENNCRFSLQIHKIIWPPSERGV